MAELETKLETFSDQLMGFSILTSPPFQSAQPSVLLHNEEVQIKYQNTAPTIESVYEQLELILHFCWQ